jgi:putative exporter of polyketide antibiotics
VLHAGLPAVERTPSPPLVVIAEVLRIDRHVDSTCTAVRPSRHHREQPAHTFGLILAASCLERSSICGLYVSLGTYLRGGEGAR